jgi:hypothetical protein
MLRVSLHLGALDDASRFSRVALLDIGYAKLAALASYHCVLSERGLADSPVRIISQYPRWSSTLWDLVARAMALCLQEEPVEQIPAVQPGKHVAYASQVSALIEHLPGGQSAGRRTLATANIKREGRRGQYVARFEEHTMKPVAVRFAFTPAYLRLPELLLHASAHRVFGEARLGPRPALCIPDAVLSHGTACVPIHRLVEPARTGFLRWLETDSDGILEHPGAPMGVAPASLYSTFLQEAI